MNKIFVMAMAASAMIFVACNGSSTPKVEDSDSVKVEVAVDQDLEDILGEIEEDVKAKDPKAVLSSIDAYKIRIQKLIGLGKSETAKKYINALQSYVESNKSSLESVSSAVAESAMTTVTDLIDNFDDLPVEVQNAAQSVAKKISTSAVETGKTQIESAKAAAKSKADEVVESAKAKANDFITQ